jgi:hypothetical protein
VKISRTAPHCDGGRQPDFMHAKAISLCGQSKDVLIAPRIQQQLSLDVKEVERVLIACLGHGASRIVQNKCARATCTTGKQCAKNGVIKLLLNCANRLVYLSGLLTIAQLWQSWHTAQRDRCSWSKSSKTRAHPRSSAS